MNYNKVKVLLVDVVWSSYLWYELFNKLLFELFFDDF